MAQFRPLFALIASLTIVQPIIAQNIPVSFGNQPTGYVGNFNSDSFNNYDNTGTSLTGRGLPAQNLVFNTPQGLGQDFNTNQPGAFNPASPQSTNTPRPRIQSGGYIVAPEQTVPRSPTGFNSVYNSNQLNSNPLNSNPLNSDSNSNNILGPNYPNSNNNFKSSSSGRPPVHQLPPIPNVNKQPIAVPYGSNNQWVGNTGTTPQPQPPTAVPYNQNNGLVTNNNYLPSISAGPNQNNNNIKNFNNQQLLNGNNILAASSEQLGNANSKLLNNNLFNNNNNFNFDGGNSFGTNSYTSSGGSSSGSSSNNNVFSQNARPYDANGIFRAVSLPNQSQNNNNRFVQVLNNRFIPPTTYRNEPEPQQEGSKPGNSFFDVTNPLADKRQAIRTYVPTNNFVDPSNFIIPSDDKYKVVNNIFSGFPAPKQGSELPTAPQRGISFSSDNPNQNLDDRFKNFDQNIGYPSGRELPNKLADPYNQNQNILASSQGVDKTSTNLLNSGKQSIGQNANSQYNSPLLTTNTPSIYNSPKPITTNLNQVNLQGNSGSNLNIAPSSSGQSNAGASSGGVSLNTAQGYQSNNGYSNQGGNTFNNNYDVNSNDGKVNKVGNFGSDGITSSTKSSFASGTAPAGFGVFSSYQGADIFDDRILPANNNNNPYQPGGSVFSNQPKLTPLFPDFSPNKRLTVDEFRSKNLLGDQNFGNTDYDKSRPNSLNLIKPEDYQTSGFSQNFGAITQPGGSLTYSKGGNGFNQIQGNTDTFKNGYDNINSDSQGYSKTFDDSNFKSGGEAIFGSLDNSNFNSLSNVGGKNTFGGSGDSFGTNKAQFGSTGNGFDNVDSQGFSDKGSFSNSYQGKDSFKDGGSFSDDNSYANDNSYSDGNVVNREYSNNDEDHRDYRDGYNNQQEYGDQKTYSTNDGFNDVYTGGNKFDVKDGYNDNVNYNNKNSDSSQSQYRTSDGYQRGVADVSNALSGSKQPDPYRGLPNSVSQDLDPDANYKPFNVNKPIFNGELI